MSNEIKNAFERKYGKGSWADKLPSATQSAFMYGYSAADYDYKAKLNAEPVAWLYKSEDPFDAGQWLVSYDKINRREIKPLYLHPPAPSVIDAFPQAHRLALELECLILSCKDNVAVSKWWDSANEALEQWRKFNSEQGQDNENMQHL